MQRAAEEAGCADPGEEHDVCLPRVRAKLLVVSPGGGDGALVSEAAARLRTRVVSFDDLDEAVAYLTANRVACVLFEPAPDAHELLKGLERLTHAREDAPVVVLSPPVDSKAALAAVQAGAQDHLFRDEVDAGSLERALRHAIDRKRTEAKLSRLALNDQLTGLPNRTLFTSRLAEALAAQPSSAGAPALLFVDIDDFKRINDSLGHGSGDEALREAARRIREALRPGDVLARFGGDEFTALCPEVPSAAMAREIAERVSRALRRPVAIDGAEVVLRASIGVAFGGDGHRTAEQLLHEADQAMYEAKHRGGSRARSFSPDAGRPENELALEAALRHAIPAELVAHYQAQVLLDDGGVVGAEALARWDHPARGLVSPGEFIPVAERSGLIVPLGRWMLQEACREAARWGGPGAPRVSVNVSARQLAEGTLVDDVRASLEASGLPGERLEVELTETMLIEVLDDDAHFLDGVKDLGVSIALDDFGTGYSSLGYLKRFPIDTIKIDRQFVAELPDSREDLAIVAAVMGFARALDLRVLAEGVETAQQVEVLRELGCELAQGFHFHRPAEAHGLRAMLR